MDERENIDDRSDNDSLLERAKDAVSGLFGESKGSETDAERVDELAGTAYREDPVHTTGDAGSLRYGAGTGDATQTYGAAGVTAGDAEGSGFAAKERDSYADDMGIDPSTREDL